MQQGPEFQELFKEAQCIFDSIHTAIELDGEKDNAFLDIITTGAVDTLGLFSIQAKSAALAKDESLKSTFLENAQKLVDFLDQQGPANVLKETAAIRLIAGSFPSLRIPDRYSHLRT